MTQELKDERAAFELAKECGGTPTDVRDPIGKVVMMMTLGELISFGEKFSARAAQPPAAEGANLTDDDHGFLIRLVESLEKIESGTTQTSADGLFSKTRERKMTINDAREIAGLMLPKLRKIVDLLATPPSSAPATAAEGATLADLIEAIEVPDTHNCSNPELFERGFSVALSSAAALVRDAAPASSASEQSYNQSYEDWFHDALSKGLVSAASDKNMQRAWKAARASERTAEDAGGDEAAALLHDLAPYIDSIVCYASTLDEYEGNRIAKRFIDFMNGHPTPANKAVGLTPEYIEQLFYGLADCAEDWNAPVSLDWVHAFARALLAAAQPSATPGEEWRRTWGDRLDSYIDDTSNGFCPVPRQMLVDLRASIDAAQPIGGKS